MEIVLIQLLKHDVCSSTRGNYPEFGVYHSHICFYTSTKCRCVPECKENGNTFLPS